MATVIEHYDQHLARVYAWSVGGFERAFARGMQDLEDIGMPLLDVRSAIDLGAGFGTHAIPLARLGCSVTAIDSSASLLAQLREHAKGLPLRALEHDLLHFARVAELPVDLILCLGDTLTHLPSRNDVEWLFTRAWSALRPGGAFALSFRDYTEPNARTTRFVPVRRDDDRILTCVLEFDGDHVTVSDVLQERAEDSWRVRVSAYRKLRLAPVWVFDTLRDIGFDVRTRDDHAGMVWLTAAKPLGPRALRRADALSW